MIANYTLPSTSRDLCLIFVGLTGVNHRVMYLLGLASLVYFRECFLAEFCHRNSDLDTIVTDVWLNIVPQSPFKCTLQFLRL